jgi:hypothetical protein
VAIVAAMAAFLISAVAGHHHARVHVQQW